jgi:hypothetical protein
VAPRTFVLGRAATVAIELTQLGHCLFAVSNFTGRGILPPRLVFWSDRPW